MFRYSMDCVTRLGANDIGAMHALLTLFGKAFNEPETYSSWRPDAAYLADLLASPQFFALVAAADGEVIGGLAAYELVKFEQARSEIYIYDLAVAEDHRRQGVATALIEALKSMAQTSRVRTSRVHAIFVQADRGDDAAIALYSKLGIREDVLHFDLLPQ